MPTRLHADTVVTCDRDFAVFRPGVVDLGDDGGIDWVGPTHAAPPDPPVVQHCDGLLMPGLVNTHCHSPMVMLRGAGEDLPLGRWLKEVIWPREAKLTAEDVYWGMTLASAELLGFGVTTTCEMYHFSEAISEAVRDAGSRAIVTAPILVAEGLEHLGTWEQQLDAALRLASDDRATDPRVEVGLAAHSAYTVPLEGLAAMGQAAAEHGLLLHIHVAESQGEAAELEAEHDKTVPAILRDLGVFAGERVLAAHSVWLTDDDLAIYRDHGVAVAHCPQSNTKLASGLARVTDMLAEGITVGLGTDGPASNNDLDLWEELRLAPLLQRVRTGDAGALPAPVALAMPTREGAAALGRPDLGVLEAGRRADVVHLRTNDPAFTPVVEDAEVISHLMWTAGSRLVRDVWVDGRQVVADGTCLTVDVERAQSEVQQRAERLARG